MKNEDKDLLWALNAAKDSAEAADALVRKYLPFIKSEATKFTKHPVDESTGDELSVAMFAFHEAAVTYKSSKGAFFPYASMLIRSRLIDLARAERRHSGHLYLDSENSESDDRSLKDSLSVSEDTVGKHITVTECKEEIAEFSRSLKDYSLELSHIADNCPRHAKTLNSCKRAYEYVKANPHLLSELERTKKLPLRQISEGSGVDRKLLERHRKYMVAILLALTNGFEIIRGHLGEVGIRKAGAEV